VTLPGLELKFKIASYGKLHDRVSILISTYYRLLTDRLFLAGTLKKYYNKAISSLENEKIPGRFVCGKTSQNKDFATDRSQRKVV